MTDTECVYCGRAGARFVGGRCANVQACKARLAAPMLRAVRAAEKERRANRPKRIYEPAEKFDAARRMIDALGPAAGSDIELARSFDLLRAAVDEAQRAAVRAWRNSEPPYSWRDIARRLGVTPSAAFQRFAEGSATVTG